MFNINRLKRQAKHKQRPNLYKIKMESFPSIQYKLIILHFQYFSQKIKSFSEINYVLVTYLVSESLKKQLFISLEHFTTQNQHNLFYHS